VYCSGSASVSASTACTTSLGMPVGALSASLLLACCWRSSTSCVTPLSLLEALAACAASAPVVAAGAPSSTTLAAASFCISSWQQPQDGGRFTHGSNTNLRLTNLKVHVPGIAA
ncbi:hypothetical protein COO60DRAFT_1526213, partial [Scenedesmus sp. NREL 46B-D3]